MITKKLPPPSAGFFFLYLLLAVIGFLLAALAKSCKSCKLFASRLLRQQKFTRFSGFLPEGQGDIQNRINSPASTSRAMVARNPRRIFSCGVRGWRYVLIGFLLLNVNSRVIVR